MYGHLMRHPGRGFKGAMTGRSAAFPTALVAGGGVTLGPLKEDSLLARFPGGVGLKGGLPAMWPVLAMHGPAPTAASGALPAAVVEPTRGEDEDAAMTLLGLSSGPAATATLEPAEVHTQLTLVPGAVEGHQTSGLELLAAMATAAPEADKPTEPEPVRVVAPVVVSEKRRIVVSAAAAKKPKMRRLDDLLQLPPNPAPAAEAMEVEPPPSPVPDRKKFTCSTCGLVLPSYQALGGHVSSHSKVSKFSAGKQLDGAAFQFPNTMAQRQGGDDAAGFQNIPPPLPERRNRMQHPCTRCTMVFSTGQALGGHMRVHWTAERQQVNADEAMAAALATAHRRPAERRPLDFDLNELPMQE